jgi:hypothetical protein
MSGNRNVIRSLTRDRSSKAHYGTWGGAFALMLAWLSPASALACPMCFGGNNQNQEAFLYGSLFLMIVPVVSIGSLLYWAYRRTKALENAQLPPPVPSSPHVARGLPLRVVGRR